MSSGIIYDSNSIVSPVSETKSEYSYFQYHCKPTTLIVIAGVKTSSHKYNNIKLGNAINNNITAGNIVHIISNVCPCLKYLYANLLSLKSLIITYNIYETKPNIKAK